MAQEEDFSLFGPSVGEAQGMQQQQNRQQAMLSALQMGPQGNPFYVPSIGQRMGQAGMGLGQALGGLFGVQPPVIKKAQDMQEIQQETEAAGIDFEEDPIGYMKIAASNMLKKGYRKEALQALDQAEKLADSMANREYKRASGEQLQAQADLTKQTADEKEALLRAQADLASAKTEGAKIESELANLEQARKTEDSEAKRRLIDAQIGELKQRGAAAMLKAKSATARLSRESSNQMYARLLQDAVSRGEMTEADARTKLENTLFDPMRAMMQQATQGGLPPLPSSPAQPAKPSAPKADKFTVGKIYRDAQGNKAKYLGNGKWQEIK